MSELSNLGVDCLLGGDVINHMGGVTVRRGQTPSTQFNGVSHTLKTVVGHLKLMGLVLLLPLGQARWTKSGREVTLGHFKSRTRISQPNSLMVSGLSVGGGRTSPPRDSRLECQSTSVLKHHMCGSIIALSWKAGFPRVG